MNKICLDVVVGVNFHPVEIVGHNNTITIFYSTVTKMCQNNSRQSNYSINSSASKQAEVIYTSFLSSQFSHINNSPAEDSNVFVDSSSERSNSISNTKTASSPIHLDLLRSTFDFSDICPVIELHHELCKKNRSTSAAAAAAAQGQVVCREIKQIFSESLEATFTGSRFSAKLVLLVQIFGSKKNAKRSKEAISSIRVAYSLFDRETRKFLMSKEVRKTSPKNNEEEHRSKASTSSLLSRMIFGENNKQDVEVLKQNARDRTQTILDEVSLLLSNDAMESPLASSSCQ